MVFFKKYIHRSRVFKSRILSLCSLFWPLNQDLNDRQRNIRSSFIEVACSDNSIRKYCDDYIMSSIIQLHNDFVIYIDSSPLSKNNGIHTQRSSFTIVCVFVFSFARLASLFFGIFHYFISFGMNSIIEAWTKEKYLRHMVPIGWITILKIRIWSN